MLNVILNVTRIIPVPGDIRVLEVCYPYLWFALVMVCCQRKQFSVLGIGSCFQYI